MLDVKRIARPLKKPVYLVALLIVGLSVWSLSRSPVFQICTNPQTYDQHDQGSEKPQQTSGILHYFDCATVAVDANRDFAIAIGAMLTTIFTGTLWWVSGGQLRELRRSVAISEQALTDLERAYIFIEKIRSDITVYLDPNLGWDPEHSGPGFYFSVVNYGRTPGNIDLAFICFEVADRMPDEPGEDPAMAANLDAESAEIIIGGDRTFVFPSMRCRYNFTPEHAGRMRARKTTLWCYGWFRYLDIFARPHTTKFCRRYDIGFNEWVPEGGKRRNSGN